MLELDIMATDLYSLLMAHRRGGKDYTTSPYFSQILMPDRNDADQRRFIMIHKALK